MMDGLASVPYLLLQLVRGVAIVLGFLVPILTVVWWLNRRDRRRREVQQQIWDLERQIWRESLPDSQREALEEADRKQVEIAREARRRLGLPEEQP
jgi:hypothetical protein